MGRLVILGILLFGNCATEPTWVCDNFPVIRGGTAASAKEDLAVLNRAAVHCRLSGSCLNYVERIGPQNYHAICNRGFRRDINE